MANTGEQRFQAIVAPHFEALYRAAIRLTRSRQDAEDLVQDVCLRAYSRLADLERVAQPLGWLLQVQYRLFLDAVRHRRRAPFAPMHVDPDAVLSVGEEPAPEDAADGMRLQQSLERAWSHLEREQRALLALHAEGYSLGELEAICGISRNAVSARLHRARARLAKLLKHEPANHSLVVRTEN
ncbi:MAG TPA: RNA polymerase sigma factor [Gammaproteobacteria bacterium]|jgi:RNA polymerase sigma-70 factor (ECF subfamily)|nr:RNA polymerase sigma factor [Gammaproteobacteria bacterium]